MNYMKGASSQAQLFQRIDVAATKLLQAGAIPNMVKLMECNVMEAQRDACALIGNLSASSSFRSVFAEQPQLLPAVIRLLSS